MYKANVSWAYYLSEGDEPDCEDDAMLCAPKKQNKKCPVSGIHCPLSTPSSRTVSSGTFKLLTNSLTPPRAGTLPAVAWVVPDNTVSEHPPAKISTARPT